MCILAHQRIGKTFTSLFQISVCLNHFSFDYLCNVVGYILTLRELQYMETLYVVIYMRFPYVMWNQAFEYYQYFMYARHLLGIST